MRPGVRLGLLELRRRLPPGCGVTVATGRARLHTLARGLARNFEDERAARAAPVEKTVLVPAKGRLDDRLV